MIEVTMEPRPDLGHLGIYLRLRHGDVHKTVDLRPGLVVDVDHEGNILGIDITKTFTPTTKKGIAAVGATIRLGGIQAAIERHFGVKLDSEFQQVRQTCAVIA